MKFTIGSGLIASVGIAAAVPFWGHGSAKTVRTEFSPISIDNSARPISPQNTTVGTLPPAVSAVKLDGTKWNLSELKGSVAVIVCTSPTCPVAKVVAPKVGRISNAFSAQGVKFLFADEIDTDTKAKFKEEAKSAGFQGQLVQDPNHKLASALGLGTTTAAVVLDKSGTIIYAGAVDDSVGLNFTKAEPTHRFLEDAIQAALRNETPTYSATTAPGCEIGYQPTQSTTVPTYYKEVSRIVQAKCLACHRAGGVAPFSLESAQDLISHAGMISYVIGKRTMPPWFAAPTEGPDPWINDRSLTGQEQSTLTTWLTSSHPMGNIKDAPAPAHFKDGWEIGQPTEIVSTKTPFHVPADGVVPYQYQEIPTHFGKDMWIQAVQVRPGQSSVVHHVVIWAIQRDPDGKIRWNGLKLLQGDGLVALYAPGSQAMVFPKGYAMKLPKDSVLLMQMHYTPNGTAVSDLSQVGFNLTSTPPVHQVHVMGIANFYLKIPPKDPAYSISAAWTPKQDIKILAMAPHMHLRGQSMGYQLMGANGNPIQTLLSVPHYDFRWQGAYRLAEPLPVSKGQSIKVTAVYNNSSSNAANPDPNQTVTFGDQTTDEMMIGFLLYING